MLNIKEYVDIKEYSSLHLGGQFRFFVEVVSVDDLYAVYMLSKEKNLPIFVLGSGSNIVFPAGVLEAIALKMNISLFEIVEENDSCADIRVGAGNNWDLFVEKVVDMGLSGVESLSAIPGTVGATPVQNVGAYGAEVKDIIVSVEVYDKENNIIKLISNEDCKFAYRDSIFKGEAKGKYIITSVIFRLKKDRPIIPNYPGVKKYFLDMNINNPTLLDIRNAIISIRSSKLPNPKEIPNVGSFFKNPIVEKSVATRLSNQYEKLVTFPVDGGMVKIPAGFLIENAGLKGKSFGTISVYDKNALVLVNNGDATCADITKARDFIIDTVKEKFGITLEAEPEFLNY
jgi:UDP-N-acetylmuramate dehydrogenase